MKRIALTLVAISAVSASFAGVFTNDVTSLFVNGVASGSASSTTSTVGDSHYLNISNYSLSGNDSGDIAWGFDYNAAPNLYSGVTWTVEGTITGGQGIQGSADLIANEKVYDAGGNLLGDGTISDTVYSQATGGTSNFTKSITINFSSLSGSGKTLKDHALFTNDRISTLTINKISQAYIPVPEPASMAFLGLSLAGIIAKKRKK